MFLQWQEPQKNQGQRGAEQAQEESPNSWKPKLEGPSRGFSEELRKIPN